MDMLHWAGFAGLLAAMAMSALAARQSMPAKATAGAAG
jgi:hypothetical protein